MSLQSKIKEELEEAIRAKKEVKVNTLRMLNAQILNKEKEKRLTLSKEDLSEKELLDKSKLTEDEIVGVINSEAKKRREAITEYEKGERDDLVEKEKKELEVLSKYLPEQLSEEEIRSLVKKAIEKVGAQDIKDIGKVMGVLMSEVKGKADGSLVNKIVREILSLN
jgi:uncharacterized protein YqeY